MEMHPQINIEVNHADTISDLEFKTVITCIQHYNLLAKKLSKAVPFVSVCTILHIYLIYCM